MGLSTNKLQEWKTGHTKPTIEQLLKLADYFKVSIDYLLGRTDLPANAQTLESLGAFNTLPVIGSIAAGYDGEAVEELTGELQEIPDSIMRGYPKDELFVLNVKGDSMYPDCQNGDRVLVHRQTSVDSGDIAVVMYNGNEATLKQVVYKKGQDWFDMIPRNPDYKVKRIQGADLQECRILGKVIYLFRKF